MTTPSAPSLQERESELLSMAIIEHLGPEALAGGKMTPLDAFECGWKAARALPPQPVVPEWLREFVEAIAHNYDAADENGERVCRGCSGLVWWDVKAKASVGSHRVDCIVPRAQAMLAAAPSPVTQAADREPKS